MNIVYYTEPFQCIEIFNLYTEEESKIIFDEILNHTHTFETEEELYSAKHENNESKTKKLGLFWDDLYHNRDNSKLLKLNRKLFHALNKVNDCPDNLWFFKYKDLNYDTTLISYYENGGYYNPHIDDAYFTALTWFWKEPKSFKGGDLVFPDYDFKIELKQNYTILFPSNIKHAVEPIEIIENKDNYYGRFAMTQFVTYVKKPQNNSGN